VPGTPGQARHRLEVALTDWGIAPDDRWSALMTLSELVTNAVEHARTPLIAVTSVTAKGLLIEVQDESTAEPRLQESGVITRRGHGLRVVEGLACDWGWRSIPGGKTVWATVPIDETGGA
jgi:two-component sensor histidine kinase